MIAYTERKYGVYLEAETGNCLRKCGATCGGGQRGVGFELSESDRDAESGSASGELQRAGRIQRYAGGG